MKHINKYLSPFVLLFTLLNLTSAITFSQVQGKVGIGDIIPDTTLDVGGPVRISNTQRNEGILISGGGDDNQAFGRVFFEENNNDAYGFSIVYNGGDDNAVLNYPSNTFGISRHSNSIDGEIALSINRSDGNVGIGTTSPSERLHVNGKAIITNMVESNTAGNLVVWLPDNTLARRDASSIGSVASEPNTLVKRNSLNNIFASRIYFALTNSTSNDDTIPRIFSNYNSGRKELVINAGYRGYGSSYDGASIHVHGNLDEQHKGALALLTGGHGRLLINEYGQIAIGGEFEAFQGSRDQLYDYMDNGDTTGYVNGMDGFLNILNDTTDESGIPSLYLSHSNKDIAWKNGEALQFGTWARAYGSPGNTGTYYIKFTIHNNGDATLVGELFDNPGILLMENINPLKNVLSKIESIQPISYEFNDNKKYSNRSHIGFSAQEIQDVFPELVRKDDENDNLSISYGHMSAVSIQAIKEQQEQIKELQKEVQNLKSIIVEIISFNY